MKLLQQHLFTLCNIYAQNLFRLQFERRVSKLHGHMCIYIPSNIYQHHALQQQIKQVYSFKLVLFYFKNYIIFF